MSNYPPKKAQYVIVVFRTMQPHVDPLQTTKKEAVGQIDAITFCGAFESRIVTTAIHVIFFSQ